MILRHLHLVCLLFVALGTALAGAAPQDPGPRPEIPVFDPLGFLPAEVVEEISENLLRIRKDEQVDVIVVVYPDFEPEPPADVARRFAEAWADDYANGIVLYSPGREDGPWIVLGGNLIRLISSETRSSSGSLSDSITKAEQRSRKEPQASGKIRAASSEAADILRYFKGLTTLQGEAIDRTWKDQIAGHRSRLIKNRVLLISSGIGLIFFIAFFAGLGIALRNRRPRRFPSIYPSPRLGAPHCGGNSVISDLGPPPTS